MGPRERAAREAIANRHVPQYLIQSLIAGAVAVDSGGWDALGQVDPQVLLWLQSVSGMAHEPASATPPTAPASGTCVGPACKTILNGRIHIETVDSPIGLFVESGNYCRQQGETAASIVSDMKDIGDMLTQIEENVSARKGYGQAWTIAGQGDELAKTWSDINKIDRRIQAYQGREKSQLLRLSRAIANRIVKLQEIWRVAWKKYYGSLRKKDVLKGIKSRAGVLYVSWDTIIKVLLTRQGKVECVGTEVRISINASPCHHTGGRLEVIQCVTQTLSVTPPGGGKPVRPPEENWTAYRLDQEKLGEDPFYQLAGTGPRWVSSPTKLWLEYYDLPSIRRGMKDKYTPGRHVLDQSFQTWIVCSDWRKKPKITDIYGKLAWKVHTEVTAKSNGTLDLKTAKSGLLGKPTWQPYTPKKALADPDFIKCLATGPRGEDISGKWKKQEYQFIK